ncbi:late competence development ComFB family protein [Inhella gelatinilytica]|uniref:Late competence development ComFB family protein n=1 Tax=Inhella gelatinilytica TaxID=2795030 RepID=A0A931NFB3_9BURK|nr:late competence development ComFB family protein [Inhella gelatinilytica]MBH9554075.1 late competence development ComFB family protein [Inhella gelatinilytica]
MANPDFSQIYNHHEREVFAAVMDAAADYPDVAISQDLLLDVACVALNRLPPRYIRHAVDFSFYLTEHERLEIDQGIIDAVAYAFNFVGARVAMRNKTS